MIPRQPAFWNRHLYFLLYFLNVYSGDMAQIKPKKVDLGSHGAVGKKIEDGTDREAFLCSYGLDSVSSDHR